MSSGENEEDVKEMRLLRKIRKREERRGNIELRRVETKEEREGSKEWIEKLLKEKLEVEVEVRTEMERRSNCGEVGGLEYER